MFWLLTSAALFTILSVNTGVSATTMTHNITPRVRRSCRRFLPRYSRELTFLSSGQFIHSHNDCEVTQVARCERKRSLKLILLDSRGQTREIPHSSMPSNTESCPLRQTSTSSEKATLSILQWVPRPFCPLRSRQGRS